MKITHMIETTTEADAIRCILPIRYDDDRERMQSGPLSEFIDGDNLVLVLDLATGCVRDWPAGVTDEVHMKVTDTSSYELLGPKPGLFGEVLETIVATRSDNYVPKCVPSKDGYGDYFIANIGPDGRVDGWTPNAREIVRAFFPERE